LKKRMISSIVGKILLLVFLLVVRNPSYNETIVPVP
jgi:hypothetical protein